ncbi:hypothetical protein [Roseobacter weihaiensis]|uniref:hypothetical protein n=1 Tax=Roseobacter weihaiensis TaxID=2763262 RepID=UPI001D0A382E|nr:hypothetical protein [Roseobacter sp. H9]
MKEFNMKSREFILGLSIFLILGAWAASAQSEEPQALPSVALSGNVYELEALTGWKRIQLHAAAMANPEKISQYKIGKLVTLEKSKELSDTDSKAFFEEWALQGAQMGILDEAGKFNKIDPIIELCPTCTPTDVDLVEVLRSGSRSEHVATNKEGEMYSADEVMLFWSDTINLEPSEARKVLLKPTN